MTPVLCSFLFAGFLGPIRGALYGCFRFFSPISPRLFFLLTSFPRYSTPYTHINHSNLSTTVYYCYHILLGFAWLLARHGMYILELTIHLLAVGKLFGSADANKQCCSMEALAELNHNFVVHLSAAAVVIVAYVSHRGNRLLPSWSKLRR